MADNRYNSGRQSAAPRQDRRGAYLAAEQERRIKEAAARRRAEEERLRREAAAAREAARREAKRREELERQLAARRREREHITDYKSKRRNYEKQRRADEERRRRAKAEERENLRRRRHIKRVFRFHIGIFAAAAVFFIIIIAAVIHRYFYSDLSDPSRKVSYYFDGEKVYTAPKEVAYCDGEMCFDFSDVADRCGFYVAGDKSSMKYVVPGENTSDTIEFIIGSDTALVNGTQVSLGAASRYIGSSLWVSCRAADLFESGLVIERSGAGRLNISRVRSVDEDGRLLRDSSGRAVYDRVSFTYRPMQSGRTLDLVALYGSEAKGLGRGSEVIFKTDLSKYEPYMNPSDANDYLMIVNGTNTLDVSYIPDDLLDLADSRKDGRATQRLRKYAARSLEAMFIEMRAEGFKGVTVTSGFTSYVEQGNFFQKAVNREMMWYGYSEAEARAAAAKYIDPPGASDLQTGLSAVLHDLPESSVEFAKEDVYKWLKENSWKFGFTERYPEGKEEATGHEFDPCHFRYVGRFVAEWLHKTGECLEEYMAD